jgi:hypothetical protein
VPNCSNCAQDGDKAPFSAMNMGIDFSFRYDTHHDEYAKQAV